eukprot:6833098-Pyramimonas_sp.AAC.1
MAKAVLRMGLPVSWQTAGALASSPKIAEPLASECSPRWKPGATWGVMSRTSPGAGSARARPSIPRRWPAQQGLRGPWRLELEPPLFSGRAPWRGRSGE